MDFSKQPCVYDENYFLLTSLHPPITSRLIQASEAIPFVVLLLQFNVVDVREVLVEDETHSFHVWNAIWSSPRLRNRWLISSARSNMQPNECGQSPDAAYTTHPQDSRRAMMHGVTLLPLLAAADVSRAAQAPSGLLAGIQMSPVRVLDEGINACLDFLHQHTAINAIFCYTQTYRQSPSPLQVLAQDHPSPPCNPTGRKLPWLCTRLPNRPFRGSPVQHEAPDPLAEYAGRDGFAELLEACDHRGLRVYTRILDAGMNRAAVCYQEMAQHNDFVRPILYHDILSPRFRWWAIDRMQQRVLRGFLTLRWRCLGRGPIT